MIRGKDKIVLSFEKRFEDGRHMLSPALGVDIISVQNKQRPLELAYD